jgi:aminopeptidase N
VRIYHPVGASEAELADFRRQPEVLAFLEGYFGPYPFEAAGGVISYEPIPGALECQTLPVYGRGMNLDVIVHELAHQWFGDCVSPDLWRDMWLNEGFATYAGWLWTEHARGRAAYLEEVGGAYRRLREGKTGSPFDPGVGAVFSGRVYVRGAMVLHGLRQQVGDEVFARILRTWVEARHDGNGSTAEFVAHAARVAQADLRGFFDEWLYGAVTPRIAEFEPAEPVEPAQPVTPPGG